jgi:hypothetical protein
MEATSVPPGFATTKAPLLNELYEAFVEARDP